MTALMISVLSAALLTAPSPTPLTMALGWQDAKASTATPAQERDLVCNMTVDVAKAKADGRTSEYKGKTYYFCNDSCKKQFDADPAKYIEQKKGDEAQSMSASGGCCCMNNGMSKGMAAGGGMCCRRMR